MKPKNPHAIPARRRKAGAHQDGARRPVEAGRRYIATVCLGRNPSTERECDLCGAKWWTNTIGDDCQACSGEEGEP